ncbi:MAG: cyclic pyranopterin phosphate synthase MoaA, partial [Bacteroidetes bacterium]|nr:cyclic pyranopterin phosphate synthase MoaA [Bacteroidota bacterium]
SEFGATSTDYYHPNWKGSVGIIPAFSRTFCGQCNRIRITATGQLKTCLYDNGVMDLRELVRSERADDEILNEMKKAFGNRAVNGFEAEKQRNGKEIVDSMATIGG